MNKPVFSDSERNFIYVKMLSLFYDYNFRHLIGFCDFLPYCFEPRYEYPDISYFPELYKHKPINLTRNSYWFYGADARLKRIEILKQAIKETSK